MIYEWQTVNGERNFGDALYTEIYSPEFLTACSNSDTHVFFLLGSLICDEIFEFADFIGKKPVFVHCGWNGKQLTKSKASNALFVGCRGEKTKNELSKLGIEVEDLGDPIYGLEIEIFPIETRNHKILFVPHISESSIFTDPFVFGCNEFLSPVIDDERDLKRIITIIKSAEFVLSGSMHIAMLAQISGVPFALFSSKETHYIDHEVKWMDWLSVFGIGDNEINFSEDIKEGSHWYRQVMSKLEHRKLPFNVPKVEREVSLMISHELTQQRDELTQQRDELTQQRDELTQQRDELTQQRDEMINSTIWRVTKPLRNVVNLLK
jgi:hypothetical protein